MKDDSYLNSNQQARIYDNNGIKQSLAYDTDTDCDDSAWNDKNDKSMIEEMCFNSSPPLSPGKNNGYQKYTFSNNHDLEASWSSDENSQSSALSASSLASEPSCSSTLPVACVLDKLENFILQTVIEPLSQNLPNHPSVPQLELDCASTNFKRKLTFQHLSQARSLTSIVMVAAFCYDLLSPIPNKNEPHTGQITTIAKDLNCSHYDGIKKQRTTTTREVYYFYVTHFRDQKECDKAIWDLVCILELPSRQSLGLVGSPKGWFCGSINVYNAQSNELKFNGRELDPHGMAITPATYDNAEKWTESPSIGSEKSIRIESDARCILVIEKEGVYTRLSEDKFFMRYFPCILVTGKGFPDVATRRWVRKLQTTLKIPAYGLCDCNPYGVSVLDSYRYDQGVRLSSNITKQKRHQNRSDYHANDFLQLHWIGLRPSHVEGMDLPSEVFQELTKHDQKRLDSLMAKFSSSTRDELNTSRLFHELKAMRKYKVELEALHWKGAEYLCQFVANAISDHQRSPTFD